MPMTGPPATRWTWLHNVVVPACLVGAESTWAWLLLEAAIKTSKGPHADIPFLAAALPAVAAAVGCGLSGRLRWRWWWRVALVAPLGVVAAAVTAATISQLSAAAPSFLRVAAAPWTVAGHAPAVVAGTAWFVAAATWGRGTWVGAAPPSPLQAAWSLGLGAVSFVAVFAARADHHH